MTGQSAAQRKKAGSGKAGKPEPPAANQDKDEPFGTSPEESAQAGDGRAEAGAGRSSMVPGEQGEDPYPRETDEAGSGQLPVAATGGVPTPGDSQGVSVPSVQAAFGTSEQSDQVDDVRITALAPPGKPDGEVDTRRT